MELTREDSIRIAIELWTWLAETGALKREWPGWKKYGEMDASCPFCVYGEQQVHLEVTETACDACPYYWEFDDCCGKDSPYYRWCRVKTRRVKKKYAALFLEQLKQL